MHDTLDELADLSLALQKTNITLPVANKLISRQVEVFAARKYYDSEYHSEACQAVAFGTFKGVPVDTGAQKKSRYIKINSTRPWQTLLLQGCFHKMRKHWVT